MFKKPLLSFVLLCIVFVVLFTTNTAFVRATDARDVLMASMEAIAVPQPGHIVHSTYENYWRQPPAALEPADPYHLPYSDAWQSYQREETWVEIDANGDTSRWRTQLYASDGTLLQDLAFDGTNETDFFPLDGYAERFPSTTGAFRDNRIALMETFLRDASLTQRVNQVEGLTVNSVYAYVEPLPASPTVEAALLTFTRPFIADLVPVQQGQRVDFDLKTLQPVGMAHVVWDQQGNEYTVAYRKTVAVDILSADLHNTTTLFQQDIPAAAFEASRTGPANHTPIATLEDALVLVPHTIYDIHNSDFQLVEASVNRPAADQQASVPLRLQGIELASSSRTSVQSVYRDDTAELQITMLQGPTAELRTSLEHTMPTWTEAQHLSVTIEEKEHDVWLLLRPDDKQVRFVIDGGDTLLFIDVRGLSQELAQNFIDSLALYRLD